MRLLLFVLAICGFWALPAQGARYGDLEITVLPQPAPEGGSQPTVARGYVEIRIAIRNRSSKKDYQVRLLQPGSDSYRSGRIRRNERTVQAVQGTTMVVSVFQPPLEMYNSSIGVEIDGVLQENLLTGSDREGRYSNAPRPTLKVLASRGIPQTWKDDVRSFNSGAVLFLRSELPLTEWSPNWLGYTCYDVVLLTREEAAAIPVDVREALLRYVEVGGTLMIHDPNAPDRPPASEIFKDQFFNQGKGLSLNSSSPAIPATFKDPGQPPDEEGVWTIGFGQVRSAPDSPTWPTSLWAERMKPNNAPQEPRIRIIHESRVPTGGILTLVILFAMGIGPINIWLLSRRKKKMWLWWNVPAFSMATCLLIFVYSLIAEGITGESRNVVLTLLDERSHHATSCGYASYYCPLTPADGLHFSYDTEIIPLDESTGARQWNRSDSEIPKTLDWTKDQHLNSGWIASRVPTCFAIRKSEIRRERLVFHKNDSGQISVVNGLGTEIDSLHYQDDSGAIYRGETIPMGQEVPLKKIEVSPRPARENLRQAYLKNWDQTIQELQSDSIKYLRNGSYVAVTKKSPFLEESLPGVSSTGSFGIVYGITAEDDNGR